MDDDVRQTLIRFYETLRYQTEMLLHLHQKVLALENALLSNQSFSQIYAETAQQAKSEVEEQRSLMLGALDLLIQELKKASHTDQA